MGIHSTFSEKSKEGTKRTGLKNISSLIYKSISRVSFDKKTSKSVDSIEDRVDQILAKNKVISYQKSSKKGKFFNKRPSAQPLWNRRRYRGFFSSGENAPSKKVISFLISILMIFVTIASAPFVPLSDDSGVDVLSVSLDPEQVYNNDTMFVNVTMPGSYNISSVTCDMGGIGTIDLSLSFSSPDQLWCGEWMVHDAIVGDYVATVTAIVDENISYYSEASWSVLPEEVINDSNFSEALVNETEDDLYNDTSIGENESLNETTSEDDIYNDTSMGENESLNETTPLVNITDENRTANNTTSVTDDVNTTSASSDEIDANAKPYVYHTAPANSFGIRSVKVTNWSYFWDLFNQHSRWDLEYRNGSEWISCQDALTIDRSRSDDNSYEKITLNFTSPVAADYRLTFAIDQHVRSYVNRSGQYEYRLSYPVGDDETYDVFFNWSDMASIPDLTFHHGVTNRQGRDVFWFRARRNNIPQGYNVVLDPIFGDQTTRSSLDTIEDVIRGSRFTCTESGLATSISAYLEKSGGAGNDLKYAIYKASDASLVGTTQVNTNPDDGWNTMDIVSGGNLFAGTDYYLVAWAESTSESIEIYYDAGTNPAAYDTETFNGFPTSWSQTDDGTKNYSIYCTYTYAAPNITGEIPADQSTGISRQPACNVTVEDAQSDLMTVEFWSNATGTWIKEQTNTSVSSLDSVVWSSFTNASEYNTTYWWSVNVTDGTFWTNQTYCFTTRTEHFVSTPDLGWEFLDNNTVIHAWNKGDSYYFNASNGIQFSNHYQEYWATNVLMLGYYSGGNWNLIYRTDELSGFTRNFEGETDSFMNLTLWRDLSYGGYDFRLAIRYHLGVDDHDLTVIPYIKNLGVAIPYTLGFGWELKDIKIANTYENDFMRLEQNASNATVYSLHNSSLDESYTNLTFAYTDDNQSWTWMPRTEFHLDNHKPNGDTDQTLYLKWDSNLTYKLQVKHREGQYNAPVTLFVRVGTLGVGQEKSTAMQWYDAYVSVGSEWPFANDDTVYIATCPINETDFLITYGYNGNAYDGVVVVGRVDGTTVSYGIPFTFDSDVGSGLGLDICIVNDTTNRFFIAYADDDTGGDDGYIYTGTFTGMTINSGSSTEFVNANMEHPAICKIRDDYAVVCYNNADSSDTGEAIVVYWDGSLNAGNSVEIDENDGQADLTPFYMDCAQLDTDKFVVSLVDTESSPDAQKSYVGTVSDTTITMGTSISPFSGAGITYRTTVSSYETDKYVYLGAGATTSEVTSYTVSTRDITEDASADCGGSHETDLGLSGALLDSNSFVVAYADENNGDQGTFIFVNISWLYDTVTWDGTSTVFNGAATYGGVADLGIHVCRLNSTHFVVAYQDDADSDHGKCVVGYRPVEPITPYQTNEGPASGSANQPYNPTLNVTCNDYQEDTMSATWWSNSSGSWLQFESNSSILTGTSIQQVPVNFTNGSVKYWWSVNLTDGTNWGNYTYSFTTEANVVPSIASETPTNESTQISRWPACSATAIDNNSEAMTVYFYENTTGSWKLQQTNSSVANNTNVEWSNYSNASSFSTKYWWSVNVTDGESWTNETYHFTSFLRAILNITWAVDSQLNDSYTSGSPYQVDQGENFTMNATIKCDGEPGATCGVVTLGSRYEYSGGTMNYTNITEGDTPFYVLAEGGGGGGGELNGTWYNRTPATAAGALSGRELHYMAYNSSADRTILFGGMSGGSFNDTWVYSYTDNTWTEKDFATVGGPLYPRNGGKMVYDAAADRTIMIGGNAPGGITNEIWVYDYDGNTWYNMTPTLTVLYGTFFARERFGLTYDSSAKRVILACGGDSEGHQINETWEYNASTNTLMNRTPGYSDGTLLPTSNTQMAYDEAADRTILFGGNNPGSSTPKNYTWAYSYQDNTWTNMTPTMTEIDGKINGRIMSAMVYDASIERVILFSGMDNLISSCRTNDTWIYNFTDNAWCNVTYSTVRGTLWSREATAMVYDTTNERTIAFGGFSAAGCGRPAASNSYLNDTWIYNFTRGAENPKDIGTLNQGDSPIQINFTINTTGTSGTWKFDLNATSSYPDVQDNNTDAGYVLIGAAPTTVPTVITNESTGVEETNATLWGYLQDNGSADTTCWFLWDTSSPPTTKNVTQGVKADGTEFSYDTTPSGALTKGTLYYVDTKANNSAGWDESGGVQKILTKPDPISSFTATTISGSQIDLSWTDGTGGDGAYIEYASGSAPPTWNVGDGTKVDADGNVTTTFNHNSLTVGTRYYYKAWAYATDGGWTSSGNATAPRGDSPQTADEWTNPGDPTGLATTNGSNWVNVTFTHGQNGENTTVRRNASGSADYPADRTSGTEVDNTTNAYVNDTGRVSEVKYYYSLWTWDTDGSKWCDNKNFTNGTTTSAGADITFSLNRTTWHMGSIDLGANTTTTNINLTNTGEVNIDVQIKADNATNSTSGFTWNLTSTINHNNFSLQYNQTPIGGTWTEITTAYAGFVTGLPPSGTNWQTFDLKIFMATTTDTLRNMSFNITLKSVAS